MAINPQIHSSKQKALKGLEAYVPWFSRAVMALPVLILGVISHRYFSNPGHAIPGVVVASPEGFTDLRAMGAWTLTLMLMLIVFLSSQERLWLGHLEMVAFMGLTLGFRVFGFLNDGTTLAMGDERFITIAESVFLILNAVGLGLQWWRIRNESYRAREAAVEAC